MYISARFQVKYVYFLKTRILHLITVVDTVLTPAGSHGSPSISNHHSYGNKRIYLHTKYVNSGFIDDLPFWEGGGNGSGDCRLQIPRYSKSPTSHLSSVPISALGKAALEHHK